MKTPRNQFRVAHIEIVLSRHSPPNVVEVQLNALLEKLSNEGKRIVSVTLSRTEFHANVQTADGVILYAEPATKPQVISEKG